MRRPNRSRMKGELRWFSIRREGCSEYQVHTYLDPHAVTPGPQSPLSWAAAGWHWAPCIGGQRSAGNSSMGSMAPHAATLVSQCRITACRRGSGVTLGMAVGRLRPRNLVPGSGTPPPSLTASSCRRRCCDELRRALFQPGLATLGGMHWRPEGKK